MKIEMLCSFQIERFILAVLDGEGYLPDSVGDERSDSLSDLQFGYYMGVANIKFTNANYQLLRFMLENWSTFVDPELPEENKL